MEIAGLYSALNVLSETANPELRFCGTCRSVHDISLADVNTPKNRGCTHAKERIGKVYILLWETTEAKSPGQYPKVFLD
jgi:hypothetical protein